MIRLLFVDDDVNAHRNLGMALDEDYQLVSAYTGAMGIKRAVDSDPDVILLDIELPDLSGIEVLRRLPRGSAPVVMLTAHGETQLVVQAMRAGAFDYLTKPYDLGRLEETIRHAARAGAAATLGQGAEDAHDGVRRIIGSSPVMREIRRIIPRFAAADATVCILGESGTGKELVARAIHDVSHRADGPFVAVNCGALPGSILESELFGSERGAYTDAVSRPGKFEQTEGGTLLLDEVGELSPQAQVGMLRVLEERRVTRVGGSREIAVDVRIIAATNRDLKRDVDEGRFRADLFYRVVVLCLDLPPLRDRAEDIPLLAQHLLLSLDPSGQFVFAPEALEKLTGHRWPGNVRELRNVLQRAVVLCEGGEISSRDVAF